MLEILGFMLSLVCCNFMNNEKLGLNKVASALSGLNELKPIPLGDAQRCLLKAFQANSALNGLDQIESGIARFSVTN